MGKKSNVSETQKREAVLALLRADKGTLYFYGGVQSATRTAARVAD